MPSRNFFNRLTQAQIPRTVPSRDGSLGEGQAQEQDEREKKKTL